MKLLGWTNPLPEWLAAAVETGQLRVLTVRDKKYGDYEVLAGVVESPAGFTIEYREGK